MNENKGNNSTIGFIGLLQIAFIVLKLCNVITWSWFLVLSPIWIEVLLVVIIVLWLRR